MNTHPISSCPSCGSRQRADEWLGPQARLNKCTGCGLVYAPEAADPDEIYVDGYLKGENELGFGLDVFHPLFQALLGYIADVRMRLLERTIAPPGRLLDVGCGSGEVMLGAQRRGWTVQGVEPVSDSVKIAQERGLDVREALLQDSGLPERSYDVVCAFHVLEHMAEATDFLRLVSRWARPGGYVLIEVPNYSSVHRWAKGAAWPGLRQLEHLCHFSPKTLAGTIRRAGIKPVRVLTPSYPWRGQSFHQLLSDLGLYEQRHRLARLARQGELHGEPAMVPTRLGWAAFRLIDQAWRFARVGPVIFATGRVP
jgi:2-polyprenyl-3-methyl-5-hydroxy-6-metoxy-1,4-benzoquinol methylase